MKFGTGFLTGLLLVSLGIIIAPEEIGTASLALSDVLAIKFLQEPLQINRYDPCPDVIDFKIRP